MNTFRDKVAYIIPYDMASTYHQSRLENWTHTILERATCDASLIMLLGNNQDIDLVNKDDLALLHR